MGNDLKIHIRGKVTGKWKEAVTDAIKTTGPISFFSPYVTEPTALDVLKCGADKCSLYTDIDPVAFALGASSLDVVRQLIKAQVNVFWVKGIHAKMLLIPGKMLTIGSQNLTRLGASATRFEASVTITDKKSIDKAHADVDKWTRGAIKVTEEMLNDLDPTVKSLKQALSKHNLHKQASEAVEMAHKNQKDRDAKAREEAARKEREAKEREAKEREAKEREAKEREEAARKENGPQPHSRRHLLKPRLDQIKAANKSVQCRINTDDGTLRTLGSDRFSLWREQGNRLDRYLCFDAESMRWGWARVGKQRISRIHTGLSLEGVAHIEFAATRLWFSVVAKEVTSPDQPNIEIVFHRGQRSLCTISGLFLLDDLLLDTVVEHTGSPLGFVDFDKLRLSINNNENGLKSSILAHVSRPFSFEKAMVGKTARGFFGEGDFRMSVERVQGAPILVAYRN